MSATSFKKIIAEKYSTNFRDATRIVVATLPTEIRPTELLVRNRYVGINASDINFTAGIYQPDVRPPFDCGFEALGEVAAVGKAVKGIRCGDVVVTQHYGAFAEYQVVPQRAAKVVPSLLPAYLPLDLSGTTASVALGEVLRARRGETAIVTAASGGTGQFAVQLLKHVYGCRVVGFCSAPAKEKFLTESLQCDGVVNYNTTGLGEGAVQAVHRYFPTGANVAYESVGGDLFDVVQRSMALKGRVLSIGAVSTYKDGSVITSNSALAAVKPLPLQLLSRSLTLHTFFLPHYIKYASAHFQRLCQLLEEGTISSFVDETPFEGIEQVSLAIEHMFAQKNCGKIMVKL